VSARAPIAAAIGAALLLTAVYAALGGGRYQQDATADPCEHRAARAPDTDDALVERLTLSALDGAGCALDLSREELALAFFSEEERVRFARRHDLGPDAVEAAVRAAIVRAVEEAERTGTLDGRTAALVAAAARWLPLDRLLDDLDNG
jgi:hypothetical protein